MNTFHETWYEPMLSEVTPASYFFISYNFDSMADWRIGGNTNAT
jgi:hypothetical protein